MNINSYQDEFHSDDDTCSTGADSGYSIGQEEKSFLTRFISIPLVQDSLTGAHQMVQHYSAGQKVLDYAQHMISLSQPYLPSHDNKLLVCANDLGNKSLELLERQFPMIHEPTDTLVNYIQTAISQKKSAHLDVMAEHMETMFPACLPSEQDHLQGMDRLMKRVNDLSSSISNTIAHRLSATMDEERQIKQMMQDWILEQIHLESFKATFGPTVQTLYHLTQTEFDKFHQELVKPNMSHMDRMRNILVLSQTDILIPLYQKSVSSLWKPTPA